MLLVFNQIDDYQPKWTENRDDVLLTKSIKQATALLIAPSAAIAVDYRHGITADYLPFVRAAKSAGLANIAVIIANTLNAIEVTDFGARSLSASGVELIDACALEARRLFGSLLGMTVAIFCDYTGTEDFDSLPDLLQLPEIPDPAALVDWMDRTAAQQPARTLKPFKAHVYASRRTGENSYTADINTFEGVASKERQSLYLHGRQEGSRVTIDGNTVVSDRKMHTGDIVTREEIDYSSELRGTLSLNSRDMGGPIRQIFNDAAMGFALGALGTHGELRLPVGIGKILPGAIQTGVRVKLLKPMPFVAGDNLTVSIASKEGKRFCGSFTVSHTA